MVQLIIVIEDDKLLRRSLAFFLEQAGYKVFTASNAEDGLSIAEINPPDLVLLDIGLPGMDGLEAIRHFEQDFDIPIILITARRREFDEILGLELGADDYITKPFDSDVLLARVKASLRRKRKTNTQVPDDNAKILTAGDIIINQREHTVQLKKQRISLSPLEFKLLFTLMSEPEKVFSTEEILARVWGAEYSGQPQIVYVHLRALRKKLEGNPDKPSRIVTIRGVGYKFIPQENL